MHDKAGAATEDRMELILARKGEAGVASLFETDELLISKIPATRSLIEVPAHPALISDLRRTNFDCRRADGRIHARDFFMLGQIDDFCCRTDAQTALERRH